MIVKPSVAIAAGACVVAACATIDDGSAPGAPERVYYAGADLSWVNELEDCGAEYRVNGAVRDPYEILAEAGLNTVRVRVWVDPDWTDYSTLHDAARSLRRAKSVGAMTLLDFHYSDTWADPGKQIIPAAWADDIDDTPALAEHVYAYTTEVLTHLGEIGLMPDMVQVGNEINTQILRPADTEGDPIDWPRNAALLNAGVKAVRDMAGRFDKDPAVMLHIAQPENVEPWFEAAAAHGLTDFDFIGISYYPFWSEQSMAELGATIGRLRATYDADVIVVETGYPWTLGAMAETAPERAAQMQEPGYPASVEGQRAFLVDLAHTVSASGGVGVFTWEPAAVPTRCSPRWEERGQFPSSALFDRDNGNELLPGADYLRAVVQP